MLSVAFRFVQHKEQIANLACSIGQVNFKTRTVRITSKWLFVAPIRRANSSMRLDLAYSVRTNRQVHTPEECNLDHEDNVLTPCVEWTTEAIP